MPRLFFICIACSFALVTFSQDDPEIIEYSRLATYKVDENRFEFGWLPNSHRSVPCFRDYTKSKFWTKIIDLKTDSIIYTSSEPQKNGLKIVPGKITLDKKSRFFQIEGKITGAWESVMTVEFQIYIGHRNDSISNITLSPSLHGPIFYNGVKVDSTIVVDKVPSFYLTDFEKFNAYRGPKNVADSDNKEMLFNISAIIDEKSILIFGLSSRYAEVFEIGKLLTE